MYLGMYWICAWPVNHDAGPNIDDYLGCLTLPASRPTTGLLRQLNRDTQDHHPIRLRQHTIQDFMF